jgi:hypothetical protein
LGFLEASYLVLGIFLGVAGIALVRWLLLRPSRRGLTASLIEELNCFNGQIRKLTDRMGEITRFMGNPSRAALANQDLEIGETLHEMTRLLKEINAFFAGEEGKARELMGTDFTTPDEQNKFHGMGRISDDEIDHANWDDLMDRLRDHDE